MKRKFGSIDGYLMADVATLATIVLFFCKRVPSYYVKAAFLVTIIVIIYAVFISKSVVTNRTGLQIKAKGENNSKPYIVFPGHRATDVDGIKSQGEVYKIPDGVHAVVYDNGVHVLSLCGRLIYNVRGGVLETAPDIGWKDLFNA